MKKIIFGFNVTNNKKNEQSDDYALVTKRLDGWQQEELEKTREKSEYLQKKVTLPPLLLIIKTICLFAVIIIGSSIIGAVLKGNTFAQAYNNAAFLFYILPITLVGWIVILGYEKKRQKEVMNSAEPEQIEKQVEKIIKDSADELNIPEEAFEMDFLAFRYKIKKDEIKVVSTSMFTFVNIIMSVFVQNQKLCLANLEQLVEISLSDFVSIERVNKNALVPVWNKEVPPTKEPYKKYKIKTNQYQTIYVKPYYIIEFNIDGQIYDLYVPVYEISKFLQLTGIDYTDEFTVL